MLPIRSLVVVTLALLLAESALADRATSEIRSECVQVAGGEFAVVKVLAKDRATFQCAGAPVATSGLYEAHAGHLRLVWKFVTEPTGLEGDLHVSPGGRALVTLTQAWDSDDFGSIYVGGKKIRSLTSKDLGLRLVRDERPADGTLVFDGKVTFDAIDENAVTLRAKGRSFVFKLKAP